MYAEENPSFMNLCGKMTNVYQQKGVAILVVKNISHILCGDRDEQGN
jgi:hypothetical protein